MNTERFKNREMELTFREETEVKKCFTSKTLQIPYSEISV